MDTGRFELLSQLSAGPDGVAYAAFDPDAGETVALHVLSCLEDDPIRRASLVRQVRLLELADTPSVVKLCCADFNADPSYVVTECPPELTLETVGGGAFRDSPTELLTSAQQIALAVTELHRVGLVHGRLTPDRIWWDGKRPLLDALPVENGRFPLAQDAALSEWLLDPLGAESGPSGGIYCLAGLICWLAFDDLPVGKLPPEFIEGLDFRWAQDHRTTSAAKRLRKLLTEMVSADDVDRPGAREVADRLGSINGVLRESVVDRTMETSKTGLSDATQIRPPEETPMPEQIGRFKILHLLGQGGMGAVYKAEDPLDGKTVALKVLKPAIAADPKDRRRFLKEARVLGEVRSPHVTQLIEANEDNGVAYIALEFVSGPSVGSYLTETGAFEEVPALTIVADVAKALSEAHRLGIVHRDIKPDNILLSRDDAPTSDTDEPGESGYRGRLTDFGLARHQDQSESMSVTQTGTVLGTPLYMAPEQWKGSTVDPRADVYSLGVTLYYMLAGQPPFMSDQMSALMSKHLSEPVPPLQRQNDNISDAIVTIVEKAVAKDAADRYQDAAELLEDIERVLKGEPTSIVLHPQLPAAVDAEAFMTWEFQWELSGTPADLWPHVSNTDRFNRAMGLPPATFRTEVDPVVGTRRFGETKIGPVRLAWEEHPFEWIEGRRFGVLREFSSGPFVWFISTTELSERPTGGTLLTHSIRIEPRGVMGRFATKLQMGRQTRNSLDRLYRRIDQVVASQSQDDDVFEDRRRSRPAAQQRMSERIESLIDAGTNPDAAERLGQFLLEAPDQEVARIRPIVLARRFELAERDVIECCLRGARNGILSLLWDVLCPICRVASDVKDSLQALSEHEHCPACSIDFESDLSANVELIFRAHPEVRVVRTGTYCIGGPSNFPHIVAQTRLRPDERVKWNLAMPPGGYRLRSPHLPYTIDFHVGESRGVSRWEVDLGGPRPENPPPLDPSRQEILLHNQAGQETLVRVERTVVRDDALTAAQASSLALFRDLFPNEVMRPGQLANVARVTLLALSVERLESIYNSLGDTGTFAIVHDCVQIAEDLIRDAGGAVVKITSSGFLAAFDDPAAAIDAAINLMRAVQASESARGLPVKLALHRGDAMLTTINDRLDYFGMTVNSVFALLTEGDSNEVLLTQSVAGDPGVATAIQESGLRCEIVPKRTIGPGKDPVLRLFSPGQVETGH